MNISELISVSMFPHSDFSNKLTMWSQFISDLHLVEVNTESRTSSKEFQNSSQILTNMCSHHLKYLVWLFRKHFTATEEDD